MEEVEKGEEGGIKECLQCQDGRKLSGLQSDTFLPAATATAAALVIDLPDFHGPPAALHTSQSAPLGQLVRLWMERLCMLVWLTVSEKWVSCGTVDRERGRAGQAGRGRATTSTALTLNLPGVELSMAPCRSCREPPLPKTCAFT